MKKYSYVNGNVGIHCVHYGNIVPGYISINDTSVFSQACGNVIKLADFKNFMEEIGSVKNYYDMVYYDGEANGIAAEFRNDSLTIGCSDNWETGKQHVFIPFNLVVAKTADNAKIRTRMTSTFGNRLKCIIYYNNIFANFNFTIQNYIGEEVQESSIPANVVDMIYPTKLFDDSFNYSNLMCGIESPANGNPYKNLIYPKNDEAILSIFKNKIQVKTEPDWANEYQNTTKTLNYVAPLWSLFTNKNGTWENI